MVRKNILHFPIPRTNHVSELPDPLCKRLQYSVTFYQQFFCRLDEKQLKMLFADMHSRQDEPVSLLVSPDFFKLSNNCTDEELYDNACLDNLVRYVVGYRQLGEGDPSTGSGQAFCLRLL